MHTLTSRQIKNRINISKKKNLKKTANERNKIDVILANQKRE